MRPNDLTYDQTTELMKLSYLLKQTSEAINQCRENELRKFHVTPEQAGVLNCIYNIGDEVSPAELTRWLSRKPSSVSILLKRMEKQGLITRKTGPEKKKKVRVSLTEKGLEAYDCVKEFNSFQQIFKVLSPEQQQQLWGLLKPLLDRAMKNLPQNKNKYNFKIFDLKKRPYLGLPDSE